MFKFKKGLCVLLVLVLVVSGIGLNHTITSKADSENTGCERNTIISVDAQGELIVKRNELGNKPMGKENAWTVLIYLCGTDLESGNGFATGDIAEIIEAGYSEDVNVIIQTGGAATWQNYGISNENIQRYRVVEGGIELIESLPNANMGDYKTLENFVSWGVENYAAEHMGLICWNHGGGSMSGACSDENYGSIINLSGFDKAMANATKTMTDKFEFIGFDACLMATVETASVFVPYADYFIASEESESGEGWEYTGFIKKLVENPDVDGLEVGKTIVDYYMKDNEEKGSAADATLSFIDLNKIDDVLVSFNRVAKQMYEKANSREDIVKFSRLAKASVSFGEGPLVDMTDFVLNLEGVVNGTDEVVDDIKEAVIYEKHGDVKEFSTGLVMYYPTTTPDMGDLNKLRNIAISPYILNYFEKATYYGIHRNLDGFESNSWESNEYFYDKTFDYADNEFYSYNQYITTLKGNEYYKDASYINVWEKWYEKLYNQPNDNSSVDNELDKFANESVKIESLTEDTDVVKYETLDDAVEMKRQIVIEDNDKMQVIGELPLDASKDDFNNVWFTLEDGQYIQAKKVSEGNSLEMYEALVLINGEKSYVSFVTDKYNGVLVLGYIGYMDKDDKVSDRLHVGIEEGTKITPIYTTVDIDTGDMSETYGTEVIASSKAVEKRKISEVSFAVKKVDAYGDVSYSNPVK